MQQFLQQLQKQQLFSGVDNLQAVAALLLDCPRHTLEPGELLFSADNGIDDGLYLLMSGCLEMQIQFLSQSDSEAISVATLREGDCIYGKVWLDNDNDAEVIMLRAKSATTVMHINSSLAQQLMQEYSRIVQNLLQQVADIQRRQLALMARYCRTIKVLRNSVNIDPLTKLYNRRWLSIRLPRIMRRLESDSRILTLAMIDIDYFKQYNDKYGHVAGDMALQSVADLIVEHLRPADMVVRYGGEEFLAILPEVDLQHAQDIISTRLHDTIGHARIPSPNGSSNDPLTISVGLGQMKAGQQAEELIEVADKALYQAKQDGRNCTRTQILSNR